MTPQVMYRRWRPGRFGEVAGQETIVQTLRQGLVQGRVAHGYLFCGPRGTGKTSMARILAKAVNCQAPQPDGEPCDACVSCRAFLEGLALDLIEIDAASNRGIDDIRALRERVHYAPSAARYKVYIIDEVHMLTEAASNALLKTLEEPPPQTILVLATTEPQKVLATLISRCQRFDFRRISTDATVRRLQELCAGEGVAATEEALRVLARQARGSLRDAINLLEQLIVSYGASVTAQNVRDLLGLGNEASALELVEAALRGRVRDGLTVINRLAGEGGDLRQLHASVVEHLRAALLLKANVIGVADLPQESIARLQALVVAVPVPAILRALQAFGQSGVRLEVASPLPLELALVQATLAAPETVVGSSGEGQASVPDRELPARRAPPAPPAVVGPRAEASALPRERREVAAPAPPAAAAPTVVGALTGDLSRDVVTRWGEVVRELTKRRGKRLFIGALFRDSRSHRVEGQTIVLTFATQSNMDRLREEAESPEGRRAIREVFTQVLGTSAELRLELANNQQGAGTDDKGGHLVRAAQRMGARIIGEETKGP